jgi:hypothetical protein
MHRGASDIELEWQRCLHLGWAWRQYFSDEIGEPQRHRETVRESRAVEVQFRQRHDVTEHDFKVCIPLTLSTVIGLGTLGSNSYRKRPAAAQGAVGFDAQHRQVMRRAFFRTWAHCRSGGCTLSAIDNLLVRPNLLWSSVTDSPRSSGSRGAPNAPASLVRMPQEGLPSRTTQYHSTRAPDVKLS